MKAVIQMVRLTSDLGLMPGTDLKVHTCANGVPSCRGARLREPGRGIANPLQDSRTGFTNAELQYATKAHLYGLFGQAVPDTRTSIFGPGQFANSAHSEASTQTRNLHACVNPLQRPGSSPLPIHETWRTDSCGAGAEFRGPVRDTVDSHP